MQFDVPVRSRRIDDGETIGEYLTVHKGLRMNTRDGGGEESDDGGEELHDDDFKR